MYKRSRVYAAELSNAHNEIERFLLYRRFAGGKAMRVSEKYLEYETAAKEKIMIPMIEMAGAEDGPRVAITAGTLGCEYSAIAAAIGLKEFLRNRRLLGTLTIATAADVAAFEARRSFAARLGEKNTRGDYSEALAYHLLDDVVAKADYHIAIGGCDATAELEPFAIYCGGSGEKITEGSRLLAEAFAPPNVVEVTRGSPFVLGGECEAAAEAGVPSALFAAGGASSDAGTYFRGIVGALKFAGALGGEALSPLPPRRFKALIALRASKKGFYRGEASVGDELLKGDGVGVLTDYFGNAVEEVVTPAAGRLLIAAASPAMPEGGFAAAVALR